MRIFLSYSHHDARTAEEVQLALVAESHSVFFDRTGLPYGEAFHAVIRQEIAFADLFVLLVSPSSVRTGCYAQTEMKFAKDKWPNPAGHVLPVLVAPTPSSDIPAYLQAITFLRPAGSIAAETAAAIAGMASKSATSASPSARVLTHVAVFRGLVTRPAFFINVTNLSTSTACEVTHVWLETVPEAHVLRQERPLPARLPPLASWETWLFLDEVPTNTANDLFTSARVRLSTGDILTSSHNESVPDQGFVPGAGRQWD